jgi:transcriptional regulator with XRE-family HTH domain
MDRQELADLLRRRRELLQPKDVGMAAGARRRTPGLRREEVAQLAGMSPDYYIRLEQARGPQPSPQILAALARALRLTRDERDYLFHLAGHPPPLEHSHNDHVRPGLLYLLDRLTTTPAQVVSDLGRVLAQNAMAVALLGDQTSGTGLAGNFTYRWFSDPATRALYPAEDHAHHSRVHVADLRAAVGARPKDPIASELVRALHAASAEFTELWERHEVAVRRDDRKRIVHPALGVIEVNCEVLISEGRGQRLLVLSADPGSEAAQQLELLAVVGLQEFNTSITAG